MRVVAKIGTASITDDRGAIDVAAVAKLSDEVAALRSDGHEVIVVSSGRGRCRCRGARPVGPAHRHPDPASDLCRGSEPAGRGVQPRARPPRPGRCAGTARPARLRRPHAVPPRSQHDRTAAGAGLRPSGQRERRDRQRRVALRRQRPIGGAAREQHRVPTSWCCSPTWTGCTRPTLGATRQRP